MKHFDDGQIAVENLEVNCGEDFEILPKGEKKSDQSFKLHKSYLLFPTIMHMKATPAGRKAWVKVNK